MGRIKLPSANNMGCIKLPSFRFWRRRRTVHDASEKKDAAYTERPLHDSVISTETAFSDVEKPLIVTMRSTSTARTTALLPSAIAALRPRVNPTHSAYSGPATRQGGSDDDDADTDDADDADDAADTPRCRGPKPKDSDTWTGSLSSTQVSEASTNLKLKEEDVDDPVEKERRRKADEARRKAEREEQERLDFLQMM